MENPKHLDQGRTDVMFYNITPVSKPRQTRSDKWKKRPCVMRYRAFADEVRRQEIRINSGGDHVIFMIPMPKSWSKKKKSEMYRAPHMQKPDIDNLLKALLDAVFSDDSHVSDIAVTKIWDYEGGILIKQR